jgi:hypothetical protein
MAVFEAVCVEIKPSFDVLCKDLEDIVSTVYQRDDVMQLLDRLIVTNTSSVDALLQMAVAAQV